MKKFLFFLIILAISFWIGIAAVSDPGYVLITRQKLAIELPLWLVLIGLILSFILIYFLVRFIIFLVSLPKRYHLWQAHRQLKKQETLAIQNLFAQFSPSDFHANFSLESLAPFTEKNWIATSQRHALERQYYQETLQHALAKGVEPFNQHWDRLPKRFKKETAFLYYFVQALLKKKDKEQAEKLIHSLLKKEWFPPLVKIYGQIDSIHPSHQLLEAEKWLKKHPHDPTLLVSLGRICQRLQLWGKARDYLETSLIYSSETAESYQALGELFETLGQPLEALNYFKKALSEKNTLDSSAVKQTSNYWLAAKDRL
jgi:HemY protein